MHRNLHITSCKRLLLLLKLKADIIIIIIIIIITLIYKQIYHNVACFCSRASCPYLLREINETLIHMADIQNRGPLY